jgi:alkylhydroperoxidase family enzyme
MSYSARLPPRTSHSDLDRAISDFSAVAVRASAVDPVTTELVRLRCARYHDCRACGSLRSVDAIENGLNETLADKIDRYETSDLAERFKVALRLTDAMIANPGDIDDELFAAVHEHFSDREVVEMALDIVKWSFQKAMVAARLEAAPDGGIRALSFDDEGHSIIGQPLKATTT